VSRVTDDPHRFFPRSDGRMFTADGRVESGCPSGYVTTPSYEHALAEITRLKAREGVVVAEGRIDSKRCAVVDAGGYALVWMLRGRFNDMATRLDGHRVRVRVEKCDE